MSGHALVTAGAGGAGLAIARAFGKAGWRVSVGDIDAGAVGRLASSDPAVEAVSVDLGTEAGVEVAFAAAEARHGPVTTLVNNAGIGGPTARVEDVSLADWERTLAVNITGHFLSIRRAVPAMKAVAGGLIVNISSGSAKVGLPLRVPYVVSKGAVLSLSMTLARELGPSGIRVNAILPGAIRGPRIERVITEKAAALGMSREIHEANMFRYISLRTMVEPEDIAAMCVFLASPAGARITGQAIGIDGGVEWEE